MNTIRHLLRAVWRLLKRLLGIRAPRGDAAVRQLLIKLREGPELRQVEENGEIVLHYGDVNLTEEFRRLGLLPEARFLRQSFPRFVARLREAKDASEDPGFGSVAVGPNSHTPHSLDLFARMTFTDPDDRLAPVLRQLQDLPDWIQFVRPVIPLAATPPQIPDYEREQRYLDRGTAPPPPAPDLPGPIVGIDARYAWGVGRGAPHDGRGKGIRVCVVDKGIYLEHVNLPPVSHVDPAQTLSSDMEQDHGTKTLGVLGSPKTDGEGTLGICHEATFLVSPYGESGLAADVADAIDLAIPFLGRGDVIVVEAQLSFTNENNNYLLERETGEPWIEIPQVAGEPSQVPVEVNRDAFDALIRAALVGITVVEPAGNDGHPLGRVLKRIHYPVGSTAPPEAIDDGNGTRHVDETMWDPADDSLAIMVGAGRSTNHERITGNHGPRVDCQGWGEGVYATTTGIDSDRINEDDRNWYVDSYSDTSSATAIIGGLVACFQGAHRGVRADFLDPTDVRRLVRCPALGNADPNEQIGPLPDLYRLLCHEDLECVPGEGLLPSARIRPDLFVRDHLADAGNPEPEFGAGMFPTMRNRSPDVVLANSPLPDLMARFGRLAWGTELDSDIAKPGTNYFHVRVGNRGEGPDGARVEIYLSAPSSFLHPRYWDFVGAISLPDVSAKDVVVAPTYPWDASFLPAASHYSAIVLLKPYRAPDPVIDDLWTSDQFRDFARTSNDVCFRSVQTIATPADGSASFRYHLRGVPDGPEVLAIRLISQLPHGTTVRITPEQDMTSTTTSGLTIASGDTWEGPVLSGWASFDLAKNADIPIDFEVTLSGAPAGRYETVLDQWNGAAHLGRITFVVVVVGS